MSATTKPDRNADSRTDRKARQQSPPVSSHRQPMDSLLLWLTFLLLGIGIVSVYDASYAIAVEKLHGDSFHFVKMQAAWAGVGLLALLGATRLPYWKWKKVAVIGLALSVFLLLAVLIPHVGITVNHARRWLGHGQIRFQPSELAKLVLVLYLARMLAGSLKIKTHPKQGLAPPLIVIGILAALIAKEPDLGTALVLSATGLVMLFLAGARPAHLGAILGAAAVAVALFVAFEPYRAHRITAFLDPKADQYHTGYQVWHALIALGSGGVGGMGLGEGREKLFIPEPRTDFIFPVIAEEWGLIGTLALVALFVFVAARGFGIAYRTRDPFGALLAAGITTLISVQALINMAVATASIPDTGVPLPFISYGGSSLVLMMLGMGILLNISCYPDGPEGPARDKIEPNEDDWNRRWGRSEDPPAAVRPSSSTATVRRLDRARRDEARRDRAAFRE
jgi:cell division protein FtsW